MFARPLTARLTVLVALLLSAALPLAVRFAGLRLEVPGQHWFDHSRYTWTPVLLVPLVSLMVLAAVTAWGLYRGRKASFDRLLLLLVLATAGLTIGTRISSPTGFAMLVVTVLGDGSNSYYTTVLDNPEVLALARDYPARMPRLRLHAATQSPGTMLLHAGLRDLALHLPAWETFTEALLWIYPCYRTYEITEQFERYLHIRVQPQEVAPALFIGLLFPLVAALGVLPVFALGRRLAGLKAGLLAAAIYGVTPSLSWFSAAVDQIYPALAATIMLLLYVGVRVRPLSLWRLILAGLLAGGGIFLNFGFSVAVATGALFALLVLIGKHWHLPGDLSQWSWRRLLLVLACYGGGALAVLLTVQLGLGIDLIGVARVSGQLRTKLYLSDLPRPWLTWVLLNPVELAIGLGFAATAAVGAALLTWRRMRSASGALLGAVLLVLLALNFSGAARAEWSRMLMFAMPLLVLGTTGALRRLSLTRVGPAVALILAQGLYLIWCYQLFDVWGHWACPYRILAP